jgi:hypothetical protein
MWADEEELRELLMGKDGAFARVMGFGTGTTVIKGVHVMNDLAQCVLGGAPAHGGDLLCAVIREDKVDGGEDNSDARLRADQRFGEAYARAFPASLSPGQVSSIRAGLTAVLGYDGGMYRAGTSMASGLATHRTLLGAEGFRRFGVGRYLERALGPAGRERLRAMFDAPTDPLSRALAPLLLDEPLRDGHPPSGLQLPATPFDASLGAALTTLLTQPLTKPVLLRLFLLAASLGICLKLLGAGSDDGRPTALATSADDTGPGRYLRQEAVQAFNRGLARLDVRLAAVSADLPGWRSAILPAPRSGARGFETDGAPSRVIAEARAHAFKDRVYWPDTFAIALGRKAGCVMPKKDQAGWGKHLVLTGELVEALVLMFVPPDQPPSPWTELWERIRDELGLVVGANAYEDLQRLRAAGVLQTSLEDLTKSGDNVLSMAIRRGVARRLPDSGAEAGGAIQ